MFPAAISFQEICQLFGSLPSRAFARVCPSCVPAPPGVKNLSPAAKPDELDDELELLELELELDDERLEEDEELEEEDELDDDELFELDEDELELELDDEDDEDDDELGASPREI